MPAWTFPSPEEIHREQSAASVPPLPGPGFPDDSDVKAGQEKLYRLGKGMA